MPPRRRAGTTIAVACLAAGLRAAPNPRTSLSLRGEAAGIAPGGCSALSASGQVSLRF